MQEIGKILIYCAGVVVVGALLGPVLYWAGEWAVAVDLIPQLKGVPFSRYFNRAIMVAALALLWPSLRWMGLRRWQDLQLSSNPKRFQDLALGIAVSVIGLWLVAGTLLAMEWAVVRQPFRWHKVLTALGTGVAVGLIEEVFFRGALFGILRRSLRWPVALAFLSAFFAVLHFLKPHPAARKLVDVEWFSGFEILAYAFHQFSDLQLVLVGWVTLFVFGWILGYTVVKTRSLYLAMGLHGGWVFALRSFSLTTSRKMEPTVWVGKDLTTGIVPVTLLLVSLGLLWALLRARRTEAQRLLDE